MSMIMEAAMEAWDRGFSTVPETNVCSSHIDDKAIKRFIKSSGLKGKCDYCGRNRLVVELEDLMSFLLNTVEHFYNDPVNFMPYDSGYLGNVFSTEDLLEKFGFWADDDSLRNDIFNSLDPFKSWAAEYHFFDHDLYETWLDFKDLIKHKSRFLFLDKKVLKIGNENISPGEFLETVVVEIKNQKMFKTLKDGSILYRCRQHTKVSEIRDATDICSPETKYVTFPNRMSPAGISMFYGAFDKATAIIETQNLDDTSKPYLTIASFVIKNRLRVIDLSSIPILSAFDQENWAVYDILSFLTSFVEDITKKIKRDGKEHVDYIPTQILTEYFRYEFKNKTGLKIDGIIYPSSQNKRFNVCVLFMDHEESLSKLNLVKSELETKNIFL